MENSYERRRTKRLPIDLELEVNKLYKQDNIFINGISADICVTDISKTGIGFVSDAKLPMDYFIILLQMTMFIIRMQ